MAEGGVEEGFVEDGGVEGGDGLPEVVWVDGVLLR